MKEFKEMQNAAITVLENEAAAILKLRDFINDDFYQSLMTVAQSKGRLIITGIGKSAIIGNKIVATLNSTGTPSIFMHAADAIHGDLGIVQKDDVVMCISKSGNTAEIKVLVPHLKQSGNKLIAMVGNAESYLAQQADYILNTTIEQEACPNNLAPTTSTTAQMALGDALAVCLLKLREFSSNDFAKFHPGGALGKKLYMRVGELSSHNKMPQVSPEADLNSVIMEITGNLLGATAVIEENRIVGMITDGDLRRMLNKAENPKTLTAKDIMGENPKTIEHDALAVKALEIMRQNKITQVIVTRNGRYNGMVHIHDLNREGII